MLDYLGIVFGSGLLVIGIIAGIGPQNLNTMSHAIRKNHAYLVATTCFVGDAFLILVGCIGLQFATSKIFLDTVNIIGIIFMCYFLWSKLTNLTKAKQIKFEQQILSKKVAVIRALGFTLLNPLVFIDTIVIIGGASTYYTGQQHLAFVIGALLGDAVWLYGLTILSRTFADKLNRAIVWVIIDIATIIIVAAVLIKMIGYFL